MVSTQQLHVEQSCHFRAKTMDCVFCLHFSPPPSWHQAELTHPALHCSISVLASREKPNKGELSRQEQGWPRAQSLPAALQDAADPSEQAFSVPHTPALCSHSIPTQSLLPSSNEGLAWLCGWLMMRFAMQAGRLQPEDAATALQL